MGTRHLTMVVCDKKIRVAQYGQWDGYPSGAGHEVVSFIRKLKAPGLVKFANQVRKIRELTGEQVEQRWKDAGADGSGFVNMEVADKFKKANNHLSRDCGAEILSYIHKDKDPEVFLQTEFAADSLFCEWVWLVNLDTETLEVYRGFNKEPLKRGRFAKLKSDGEYHPVKLWKKIKFADLTAETAKLLQKEYDGGEDAE